MFVFLSSRLKEDPNHLSIKAYCCLPSVLAGRNGITQLIEPSTVTVLHVGSCISTGSSENINISPFLIFFLSDCPASDFSVHFHFEYSQCT